MNNKKMVYRYTRYTLLLSVLVLALYLSLLVPKRDANWVDYLVYQPTSVEMSSSTYMLSPLRDWQYGLNDQILDRAWIATTTIDTSKVTAVWFVLEPFGALPIVGHTFLTFEFEDGTAYSFSIEARREWGESYSTLQGLFRQYEVAYTWSTERDALSRRVVKDGHAVRMYKLQVTQPEAAAILRGALTATIEVAKKPIFYNTLTSNCTNELARLVNKIKPGTLPYSLAWNFPGLADNYLMQQGYIDDRGDTEHTKAEASLLPLQLVLAEAATGTAQSFSRILRSELAAQQTIK